MTTAAERIESLRNPEPVNNSLEIEVLEQWPETVAAPSCISNLSDTLKPYTGHGVLHWHRTRQNPDQILKALEASGWKLAPVSLVRWDRYRPSVYPGSIETLPERNGSYSLTDAWEILPIYVSLDTIYPDPELSVWMKSPQGKVYRVAMRHRLKVARLSASRREYRGGWEYERGTERLHFEDTAFNLEGSEPGTHVAQVSACSGCSRKPSTPTSLDGRVFWEPICNREQWETLPASHFVAQLMPE